MCDALLIWLSTAAAWLYLPQKPSHIAAAQSAPGRKGKHAELWSVEEVCKVHQSSRAAPMSRICPAVRSRVARRGEEASVLTQYLPQSWSSRTASRLLLK